MKNLSHIIAGILFGFPFIIGTIDIALRVSRGSPLLALAFILSLGLSAVFYVLMLKAHKST